MREIVETYGLLGTVRLAKNWLLTRILFPRARLIRFPIYIRGRRFMDIGEGLTTGVNVRLDAYGLRRGDVILRIGRNVQMNDAVHIGAALEVVIGDNTLIASRVFISDHDHGKYHLPDSNSIPEIRPIDRPISSMPVRIGRNVWLGEQVCVLAGVTVGDGAIVGANSVVTHDVAENSIAVGNPARVIRAFDAASGTWTRV